MSPTHCDVLSIGAGPSGAIAGALLTKKGHTVRIVERQQFPRFSIGESLLAHCLDFVEEAGMSKAVHSAGFQFKNGAVFFRGKDTTEFNFADKVAPRVGFAYDVNGDGRWKAFGSWGVFYDIFKLELPRGSFGGEKWLEFYYTLDTFDWTNLTASPNCPPACPARP